MGGAEPWCAPAGRPRPPGGAPGQEKAGGAVLPACGLFHPEEPLGGGGRACLRVGARISTACPNLRCVRVRVSTAPGDVPGHSTSVPPYRLLDGEERLPPREGGAGPSRCGARGKPEDEAETLRRGGVDGPERLPETAGRTSRGSEGGQGAAPTKAARWRAGGAGETGQGPGEGLGSPCGELRPQPRAPDQGALRPPGRPRSLEAATAGLHRSPQIPFPPAPAPPQAISARGLLPAALST